MTKSFVPGKCYQHETGYTLYIRVLSVRHQNEERIKMKVSFHHLINDRIQYTGKGSYGLTEEIIIKTSDMERWTLRHDNPK
jgi:hypothetical protein